MKKRGLVLGLLLLTAASIFAAGQSESPVRLKLATTTSTENSGLLAELLPAFTEKTGITVDVIAVGTGKAIALGRNGDVDVIMVHAKGREDKFVAEGFGTQRYPLMHNDFVILGPENDPAQIAGLKDTAVALVKIADAQAAFVSRGDDSGTHTKERNLWKAADLAPAGDWYKEAGQGMGAVLTMTDELLGYTMADRGTFLAYKDKIGLKVLVEGDERLYNPYGVIPVSPEKHPHVEHAAALAFVEYLTSAEGQKVIGAYERAGEPLFFPDVIPN